MRRPLGTSCGNDGLVIDAAGNRHNNNKTFSNASNSGDYSANDTDGGAFVKFCCDDLTTAGADFDGDGILDVGYHQVILRVWDDGNKNGTIGEVGKDNWNDTWANVKVECKIPPIITCPADKTIYCDWAIQTNVQSGTPGTDNTKAIAVTGVDFTKTGLPTAYGVCVSPIITFWDKENFNDCDLGTIQRTFIVKDKGFTTTCIQTITVQQSLTAIPWQFIQSSLSTTPIPLTGAKACEGPTDEDIKSKGPKYTSGPCDVIGVTWNKEQFDFENGVCRKWRVRYDYWNWCTGLPGGPYYKYWIFEDTKAPEMTCRDTMFVVGADCSLVPMISKKAVDTSGCINTGWLKWEVYVDLWADGQEDLLFSSFYFGAEGAERFVNGSVVKQYKLSGPQANVGSQNATSSGQELKITLPFPIVGKMSNHKVVWKVTDGCHNFTSCHESFMVVDKKAPTPVCIPLTTALMADPDGSGPALPMVELWACDFMNKAYDNCTASEDLLYTFENVAPQVTDKVVFGRLTNIDIKHYFDATGALSAFPAISSAEKVIEAKYLRGEGGIQLWDPATGCSAKVWSSNVLVPGQAHTDVDVRVTVWDKKFNYDFCWTTLSLICNTCEGIPASFVTGNVSTENSQGVRNVQIRASANLPEYPKTEMTDINGNYEMPILALTELEAFKDGDDINGVSTLDLVMIQRHILGLQSLSSPYKIIAADANNDGKVTASDLTDIRKLILGITVDYPSNTSWRFLH
ncbi:MAG: hypothetical protein IPO92_18385 [Saprospiraceae bacterium]|nr:hypothetical protein [Saprospiraceae bacterium]